MKNKDKKSVKYDYLAKARLLLYNKYCNNLNNKYNLLKINEILSNSKSHLVASFKDYLLYEEDSEFLRRYYNGNELHLRIKKYSNYLSNNPFIYPNYAPFEEKKYILSNILRKKIIINKNKRNKYSLNKEIRKTLFEKKNKIFNYEIYDEILGQQKSESFINMLFGLDYKKNDGEQFEIDEKEELNKIIKMIEINEKLYDNNSENKITVNTCFNHTINYNKINKKRNKILRNEYSNNLYFKDKSNSNLDNNYNEETKDNTNTNLNSLNLNNTNKQNFDNYKTTIYHRKVKSTLMNNITKIDLPSNSNIINTLKISNQAKKDKNSLKELLNNNKSGINNNGKVQIIKLPIANKEEKTFTINEYHFKGKKNLNKLTRNNQNNNNYSNCTNNSIFYNNKSVYVKNKVLRSTMSNRSIFSNKNSDCNKVEIKKRNFIKPYSKPKCIFKDNIKYNNVINKTYYNRQHEVIYIERLK